MAGTAAVGHNIFPWNEGRDERMKYLFDTKFLSDATLLLGPQRQKVRVHRFILEFSSPVFHNSFQEVGNNQLVIEDVDPKIFILFLRHLYLNESGATIEDCFPLLNIATKYKIQDLINLCQQKLNENFTDGNITTLFQQAMDFGDKNLIEATLTYFCRNARNIVSLEAFSTLRQECLYEILKRNDLKVQSELHLFNAVLSWGQAECARQNLDGDEPENLKNVLTTALGLIRFPVMEAEEFTLNVAMRNILADRELISMLLFFNVSANKRALIPQGRFNATPRTYYTD